MRRIPHNEWCHVHVILTRFTAVYYVDGHCFAKVRFPPKSIPPVGYFGFCSYATPFDVCNVVVTVPEKPSPTPRVPAPSSAASMAECDATLVDLKEGTIVEVYNDDTGNFTDLATVVQVHSDDTCDIRHDGEDRFDPN